LGGFVKSTKVRNMKVLETERLIVRNFQASDWQALHGIIVQYQASELASYDHQWPTSQEEIRKITEFFAGGDSFLAVCLKDSSQLIGLVRLNPAAGDAQRDFNIGYIFNTDFRGLGYATEACRAVLSLAFDQLRADKVVTGTAALNQASCRLLERLGFHKSGEETASFKTAADGKPIEFLGYRFTVSRDEWEGKKTES
jgi:[ribosomal protein S5]-alanine N-acetyltransferase